MTTTLYTGHEPGVLSMTDASPRYGMEEYASRGDALYDRDIRPSLEANNLGKFVAIDIETGDFEIDADELAASDRLLSRRPQAQTWLRRVDSRYARRIGSRPQAGSR
jgi:hypothetical protein